MMDRRIYYPLFYKVGDIKNYIYELKYSEY